ncbi:MAG: hypothetical protein AB7D57_03185 [Desulfovibrionaceae bacterium]
MNASDIAVALLLYNRPRHTMRVLESLVRNGVSRIHAFMDRAVTRTDRARQALIRAVLCNCLGMEITLHQAPEHLGLARSVQNAMNTLTRSHKAVILLEDDCLLRPNALAYFRDALIHLEHDRRIRSVCGYMFPGLDLRLGDNTDLLLLRRFFPWGWATWSDRWRDYRPDLRQALERLRHAPGGMDRLGDDVRRLCRDRDYLDGRRDIWSLSWILEHYATDSFALYPRDTLVDNIGCDGSGKHCACTDSFDHADHVTAYSAWRFADLAHHADNERAVQQFLARAALLTYPTTTPATATIPAALPEDAVAAAGGVEAPARRFGYECG